MRALNRQEEGGGKQLRRGGGIRGKGEERKRRKCKGGGGTDAGGQISCWLTCSLNMCKCTSVKKNCEGKEQVCSQRADPHRT